MNANAKISKPTPAYLHEFPFASFDLADKWRDPFIEELHQVRARLLAKANGDMHQLVLNAHQTAVAHGFAAR
jgi:hypothetical protein